MPIKTVRKTLMGIALTCLGLQMLLVGILRAPPWPHYGFGMFPIHVLFAWLAIDMLCRARLGLPIVAAFGLSLACITFGSAWQLHRFGWERGRLSPTLANQIEVAEALDRYPPSAIVWTNVPMYQAYPHALRAIRLIHPSLIAGPSIASSPRLLIRYREKSTSFAGAIELIEIGAGAEIPADAERIDISPMPPWR
ncbi:MAG TPA: hypothetical protein VFC46_02845 [Humisphaera sp.]|nr:hypothetical protein [Humisphaera sp.]